jgi:hypothetical protein
VAYARAKRVLARDSIVILDGMNYIKGWRYQLWCEAKASNTTCCVVCTWIKSSRLEHRLIELLRFMLELPSINASQTMTLDYAGKKPSKWIQTNLRRHKRL